uniref:Uncharacterized protein n=1 Tax=Glossina pallidipes TaxID=7398 RepID=A0A1B0ADY2_GLOPL
MITTTSKFQVQVNEKFYRCPRYIGCSTFVNTLLEQSLSGDHKTPIEFDFLVFGIQYLRGRLCDHLREKSISFEDAIEIEYLERFPAPEPQDCLLHDDWVSAVEANDKWILTACYDNTINLWTNKGAHILTIPGHTMPVKAVTWVSLDGDKVWRARYTPIGNGLVSIVVPHLGRGENSLLLWSNSKQYDPVCSFVGHRYVILDFAWRPDRENPSEIELVTWSRDRTLRVWKIDDMLLKLCEPDSDSNENYELGRESRTATPTKFQAIQASSLQQTTTTNIHIQTATAEGLDVLQMCVLYTHRDSNSSFYLHDRINSKHSKNRTMPKPAYSSPIVHVYDCSKLLNMSREVARELSLDKCDIIETCKKNRKICEANGRYDLLPIWTLAEKIATPDIPSETKYEMLFYNPFKKFLLEALIMHFATSGDLQTAVTLACLFHKCPPPKDVDGGDANVAISSGYHNKLPLLTPNSSPYHTQFCP